MRKINCLLALFMIPPAHASNLRIDPIFDHSITSNPQAALVKQAINDAISVFEKYVSANSPVTVSINFNLTADSSNLGSSNLQPLDIPYSQYLNYLHAYTNKSVIQTTAFSSLPMEAITGVKINTDYVLLTPADLAAIGDKKDAATALINNNGTDGTISLNLANSNGKADLQATAEHEIDEVLGIGGWGSTIVTGALPSDIGAMDLYRYSAPGVRSFTNDTSTSAYFSINGGETNLVYFDQLNNAGGDFGDWGSPDGTESNNPPQVQDAAGGSSTIFPVLGVNELTGLNAIGWDLTPAGASVAEPLISLPTPSSIWLMLSGLLLMTRQSRKTR